MIATSIVLIHPSRLFAEGLGSLLKDAPFKLAFCAASADAIPFEALPQENKLVFIVGGRSCAQIVEAVEAVRARVCTASIVVIGACGEPGEVMVALEAGANGYLREAMAPQTLIMAVELVCQDEMVLPPEFIKQLLSPSSEQDEDMQGVPLASRLHAQSELGTHIVIPRAMGNIPSNVKLSTREEAILQSLVDGAPNKIIAQQLKITEATVKVHVKSILRKIRVTNRTQAAIWAVKYLDFSQGLPGHVAKCAADGANGQGGEIAARSSP
jgi:two-component system nitrate/nitrite response regulator NarL